MRPHLCHAACEARGHLVYIITLWCAKYCRVSGNLESVSITAGAQAPLWLIRDSSGSFLSVYSLSHNTACLCVLSSKSSPPRHGYRLAFSFVSCEGGLQRNETTFEDASLWVDIGSGTDMPCLVRSHRCAPVWETFTFWEFCVFLPIRQGLMAVTSIAVEQVITNFMKTPS